MAEHYLRDDLAPLVPPGPERGQALWQWACKIADAAPPEAVYRNREGRRTLRFEAAGRSYFLKLHRGVGWGEIAKNLLSLRRPVISARNEYLAIGALQQAGVDTLSAAAYVCLGSNPARLRSLVVTDDLVGTVSLEDYCAGWAAAPPPPGLRHRVIACLADSARRMHGAGVNHRDFYLCHFHLDPASVAGPRLRCHLIDLHRAQLRRRTPRRWRIKDLAGLYFSAMDYGLTRRDLLRFLRGYSEGGLRDAIGTDAALWRTVERRAQRLYRKVHGREPPPLTGVAPAGAAPAATPRHGAARGGADRR
jgi:heptose I phosphotransferase